MSGEFLYPSDPRHIDTVTRFNLVTHEIHTALGFGWEHLQFEPERLRDPGYLAMARFLIADVLAGLVKKENNQAAVADFLRLNQVKNVRGEPKLLLYPDEVSLITEIGLDFPLPWTEQRSREAAPPLKYISLIDQLYDECESCASRKVPMGIVAGCWDILHGGHLAFLLHCARYLHNQALNLQEDGTFNITCGVDDNRVIAFFKPGGKPFNDFSVRAGTIAELPLVSTVFRVPEFWRGEKSRSRYFLPLGVFPGADLNYDLSEGDLQNIREEMQQRDPHWYNDIAPFIYHFWSAGDPIAGLRKRWAQVLNIHYQEVPRFTTRSTTEIARDFAVIPSTYKPNRFGQNTWWHEHLLDMSRSVRL